MSLRYFLLSLFSFLILNNTANAQLPNGSQAADFTLTDLDGNTWNLYDLLNDGKTVYLDFSATWCGPCWSYHNSHVLNDIYNTYGPDGTDEAMVFFIEADGSTSDNCLYGNCGNTQGNWVNGTDYPIINPSSSETNIINNNYGISFFPTIYVVMPTGNLYYTGTQPYSVLSTYIESGNLGIASYFVEHETCNGDDGYIEIQTVGGYGSLDITWSNGDTGTPINGLDAGIYDVTITDNNGVSITESFTVEDGGGITNVFADVVDPFCFDSNDGSINVQYESTSGDVFYTWEDGTDGPELNNLGPGDYTVTVIDVLGCEFMETFTIIAPPEIFTSINTTDALCGNDNGTIEIFASGGNESFVYEIDGIQNTSGMFDNLAPGDYDVIYEDISGCGGVEIVTIEGDPAPTAIITDDNGSEPNVLDCAHTSIALSASQSDIYAANYWEKDGAFYSDQVDIIVSDAGNYEYFVVSSNCTESASTIITFEDNAPEIDAGNADIIDCANSMIALQASTSETGNYSILWTTSNGHIVGGQNTLSPTVDAPGTYSVTITMNDTGCETTDDVVVTADTSLPTVMIEVNHMITCTTSEVTITSAGSSSGTDYLYSWSGPDNFSSSDADVTTSTPGTYNLTITNTDTGCALQQSIEVEENTTSPVVTVAGTTVISCSDQQLTLQGSADIGDDIASYAWSSSDGTITSDADQNNIQVSSAGTYTVSVTNTINGCTSTESVSVSEDINDAIATYQVATNSLTIMLTSTSSSQDASYSWDFGDGNTSTEENPSHTYDTEGTYQICYTVTTDCGSDTTCKEVSVSEASFSIASEVTHVNCYGDENGAIDLSITGQLEATSFAWSNGATTEDIDGLAAGDYTVEITAADGEVYTYSFTITSPDAITMSDTPIQDVSCNGEADGAVELNPLGGTGEITGTWSDGDQGLQREDLAAGEYTVELKDENDCISMVTIVINEPEPLAYELITTTSDESSTTEIFASGGTAPYTYLWSDGYEGSSRDDGNGRYTVTITDANGCTIVTEEFDLMTDVEDIGIESLKIFPNPFVSDLNIEIKTSEEVSYSVLDMIGNQVLTGRINGALDQISLSEIPSGSYLIKFTTSQGASVRKLIKL